MAKKMQVLKETFPLRALKIYMSQLRSRISIPKIHRASLSPVVQLYILGLIWMALGFIGMVVMVVIFESSLFFVPLAIGLYCYFWFVFAAHKMNRGC